MAKKRRPKNRMETAYVTRDPIVDEGAELERAPEKPEIALDSDETEPEIGRAHV